MDFAFLALVLAAPAPVYRGAVPIDPTRGPMTMCWATDKPRRLELRPDGRYRCGYYYGSYRWDKQSRTLYVSERFEGEAAVHPQRWKVKLDADGNGVVEGVGQSYYSGMVLRIYRSRK